MVTGLFVMATAISRSQTQPPGRDPGQPTERVEKGLHFLGTSSCSARACHGGLEPIQHPGTNILRDEYPKWLLRDKHAQAYQVLFDETSLRIAKHLAGDGAILPPHKDARCLACHTTSTTFQNPTELRLGVSCEACHGPASGWLTEHMTADWRKLTSEQKQTKGMIPTAHVKARAEACAACHVGAPDKDVNHDLIAAGHPRLNFEFSSYMANLPPHWNARPQAAHDWAIGQVEAAKAALRLLQYRADINNKRPWPEFAEYDCFACHHDLETPSWRQKGDAMRKPGTVPWGTWYFAMPNLLGDAKLRAAFADLKREMEKPVPSHSPPIKPLSAALETFEKVNAATLTKAVAPDQHGWDVAEQLFLAVCAVPELQKKSEVRKALAELSRYRTLPPEWGSPRNFSPRFFEDFRKVLHEQE